MKKLLLTLLFTPLFLTAQTTEEVTVEAEEQETKIIEEIPIDTIEVVEKEAVIEETSSVEKATEKQEVVEVETENLNKKQENKITDEVCVSGNCKNGTGTMQYQTGIYVGSWENGLRSGQGKYTWTNGDVYKGTWQNDNRHGYGEYLWHDGSKYKGNYSVGIRSGYGIYYYTNGNIYEGTWQNNLKHGIANLYFKDSANLGGKYINNKYVSGTGINRENYDYKPVSLR